MPSTGFHSEWITIGDHRVLLECRASFPGEQMRFIARVAAVTCDHNSEKARVVSIFYDDKASCYLVKVASTDPADQKLAEDLRTVLHTMLNDGNCQAEVAVAKKGNEQSDHYDHMEHLSIEAGVAVDRWRHQDGAYMKGAEPPR